jgi:hypothetical protein
LPSSVYGFEFRKDSISELLVEIKIVLLWLGVDVELPIRCSGDLALCAGYSVLYRVHNLLVGYLAILCAVSNNLYAK